MAETIKSTDLQNRELVEGYYEVLFILYSEEKGGRMKAISSIQEFARQGRWGRRLLKKFIPLLEKDIHMSRSEKKHSLSELRSQLVHYSSPPATVVISLPTRGHFRSLTNKLMAEASTRKDFDKRHVLASFYLKESIEEILNSLDDADQQADCLAEVGHDPNNYGGDIQKAARQWHLDCFNNPDNLFKGARGPNRAKGARLDPVDLPPWERNQEMMLERNLSDIIGTWAGRDRALRRQINMLFANRLKKSTE